MGLIYPVFFLGAFLIAVVIYLHRSMSAGDVLAVSTSGDQVTYLSRFKSRTVSGIGLFLKPDASADIARIENLTQEVDMINAGIYVPSATVGSSV